MVVSRLGKSFLDGLKLFKDRAIFSRLTIAYLILSLVHFALQVSLQSRAFSINARAAYSLRALLRQGNAAESGFTVYKGFELRVLWDGTPKTNNWSPNVIEAGFDSKNTTSTSAPASSSPTLNSASNLNSTTIPTLTTSAGVILNHDKTSSGFALPTSTPSFLDFSSDLEADDEKSTDKADLNGTAAHSDDDNPLVLLPEKRDNFGEITTVENPNGTFSVSIDDFGYDHTSVVLDRECLAVLNWPVDVLGDTKREDVTFLAFHFWVLVMSFVALLNESIPHIIASLLTHVLATTWTGYQLYHTADFRRKFNKLTTQGACKPVNLLGQYWQDRALTEIPSLALNILALIISIFLTCRLVKTFGWQTFKRIGASTSINRVYKIVLTLSITIQISFFFMICSLGVWLDQLFNGSIGQLERHKAAYRDVVTMVLVLSVPWLTIGWIAVRRENKPLMAVFLLFSFVYMTGWGLMFLSYTFRWTFVEWQFFRLLSCVSVALAFASFVLGIVCRLNFGKGLSRILITHEPQDEEGPDENKLVIDEEKVDFPSRLSTVPMLTASQFYKPNPAMQFEAVGGPGPALQGRGLFYPSPELALSRSDCATSSGSNNSAAGRKPQKRWVIE